MSLHPTYLAAFRGGDPPHPLHPQSKAFHAQYVAQDPPRAGSLLATGLAYGGPDPVFALATPTGEPEWWYLLPDFVRLVEHATDERYRALAEEARRVYDAAPVVRVLRAVREGSQP